MKFAFRGKFCDDMTREELEEAIVILNNQVLKLNDEIYDIQMKNVDYLFNRNKQTIEIKPSLFSRIKKFIFVEDSLLSIIFLGSK